MARIDFDNGNVKISDSNSLRWVRIDNQSGYLQNKDDYLLDENRYPAFNYDFPYFPKFLIGDVILNQFAVCTDVLGISKIEVLNWSGDSLEEDVTADLLNIYTLDTDEYGVINWYNLNLDTALYGGYYYLLMTMDNGQLYKSEPFTVFDFDYKDGVLIEWYNDSPSKNDDGIYQAGSEIYRCRIDGRIYLPQFIDEKTVGENFNNTPLVYKATVKRQDVLEYGALPWFLVEKLHLASNHDHFFVNGIEYIAKETLSDENINNESKRTLIHKGAIVLERKDYGSFVQLTEKEEVVLNSIIWDSDPDNTINWDSNSEDTLIYN